MIALDLIRLIRARSTKLVDRATRLLQRGRTLSEPGKFRAIAEVGLRRLQYQTGQYAQLLGDYKKEQESLPEAAQAEVLLLAANSERQLGHTKQAEQLYRQIIAKFPDREEAKDAAYQRLINVYNSDPSALLTEVEQFLATDPVGERADQAKLLKAEALYKQQNYSAAAALYGELRSSQLSSKLRAESAYKLGLCYVPAKNTPAIIEAFTYYVQTFPAIRRYPAALAQRALAYEQDKNYDAALADLNYSHQVSERAGAPGGAAVKTLILGQRENTKAWSIHFATFENSRGLCGAAQYASAKAV
jgi:tetratricopeptide (TPR) repeat protein